MVMVFEKYKRACYKKNHTIMGISFNQEFTMQIHHASTVSKMRFHIAVVVINGFLP
jgi:hypothetical protein